MTSTAQLFPAPAHAPLDPDAREAILAAVTEFARDHLEPHAVRWDREGHFPLDVLARAGELGLGAVYAGEDVGGTGLCREDGVAIFERLARGDTALAAYVSIHNMVVAMIDRFGSPEQRARWIPRLASLQHLASYCLTEPEAGSDAAALRTRAVRTADGWRISGTKQFISGAGASSVYLVLARTGEAGAAGISAFLVPSDAPGLSFGAEEQKMGWRTQPTRQVVLDDVPVRADALLGAEGEGFAIAMHGLNGGRLNIAACSVGGGQWAVDQAAAYLRERRAFGRSLDSFQGVLFPLADAQIELEAARSLLRDAARSLDAADPGAPVRCAGAKRFATDVGFTAANTALQSLGGYGYLSDYGIEKVVRDLRVHQILEGTNEIMRLIVGRDLTGGAA